MLQKIALKKESACVDISEQARVFVCVRNVRVIRRYECYMKRRKKEEKLLTVIGLLNFFLLLSAYLSFALSRVMHYSTAHRESEQ